MTSSFGVARMPRKCSSHISAQDLIKLLGTNCKNGFLRQKRVTKIMKSIKWQHRFIILAHNAIYVYENEMSKSPNVSIPLLGYIGIEREKTSTCAWVFALVPGVDSLSRRSFACSSDEERREWMLQIKEHLYTANNVDNTSLSPLFKEKLKLTEMLSPEEQMYARLELPILSPEEATTVDGKSFEDDEGNDSYEDEEEDEEETVSSLKRLSADDAGVSIRRTSAGETQEQIPEDLDSCDGFMPPRYSAIVEGKELVYENLSTVASKAREFGLERACTISDEETSRDRNKCIEMLKGSKKKGAYLIRRSRTKDYKVLSVLADEETVKEYIIDEAYGLFHLLHDPSHEFPTIESMLAYYSHHKPVPSLEMFLGWGIHECEEHMDSTYEETS